MGLITSRLPLDGLRPGRRRSQQEETLYSYSLNKNYFSNYFFMGGERFEVNDPDYLFGDNCDLNFLTCTKPYSLPYKKAQLNLLLHLNNKQKAMNKVSSRVNSLSTPLNILTGRNRQVAQSRKQDAQTQTLNKGLAKGPEPSQPLVMLINIRKETLRLVKSSNVHNIDSDQNSLMTNTASVSQATPERRTRLDEATVPNTTAATKRLAQKSTDLNRHSLASGSNHNNVDEVDNVELNHATYYSRRGYRNSDSSSITSNTLSSAQSTVTSKSGGYTSVKDVPPSDCASDENDECYQDALNEPTEDDSDSMRDQARENSTKENLDIRITINNSDDRTDDAPQYHPGFCDMSETTTDDEIRQLQAKTLANTQAAATTSGYPRSKAVVQATAASTKLTNARTLEQITTELKGPQASNRVYNIEFTFDAEVDCSIRIFYFCTREVTSNSVSYKPQHATYKSKTYTYKRGLNQKFEQREHTFQPYLFDEDLLIYKPLDMDGNYNSGAVFPIVIYLAALEGPAPRQSQSLVATVEKSQLDDSYSIKALKQLIFVDGVQYILQDIYGIENRPLASANASSSRAPRLSRNLRASCASLYSTSNFAGSSLNLSDTASIASFVDGNLNDTQDGDGGATNQYKSLGSENTFECVICMSDERDTMLLPCRHLCLCSSCAQSLRYQASSCPICRCPFKAALNLRVIQRRASQQHRSGSASASNEALATNDNTSSFRHHPLGAAKLDNSGEQYHASTARITRRESITSPATPLLPNAPSVPDDLGGPASEVAATVSGSAARSKKLIAAKFLPHQTSSARDTAVASQAGVIASSLASRSKSSSTTANVRDSTSNEDFSAMSVTLEMQTMSDGSGRAEERVARS